MGKIIGSAQVDPIALDQMKKSGGTWAAYQNVDLSSGSRGQMAFLKIGEECTYKEPPEQYPSDGKHGMGWRYRHVGTVNLETGLVES